VGISICCLSSTVVERIPVLLTFSNENGCRGSHFSTTSKATGVVACVTLHEAEKMKIVCRMDSSFAITCRNPSCLALNNTFLWHEIQIQFDSCDCL